jgi:hypothetical protein
MRVLSDVCQATRCPTQEYSSRSHIVHTTFQSQLQQLHFGQTDRQPTMGNANEQERRCRPKTEANHHLFGADHGQSVSLELMQESVKSRPRPFDYVSSTEFDERAPECSFLVLECV